MRIKNLVQIFTRVGPLVDYLLCLECQLPIICSGKIAAHMEGNFVYQFQSSLRSCTSVPVLYTTIIFSFTLVRLQKQSQPWKKSDEILQDQFHINDHLKVFTTAVCPKKRAKFSKGGKLKVKTGRPFSNFLKSLFRTVLSGFSLVWYLIFVKIYNL